MVLIFYAIGDIMLGQQPLTDNFGVKHVIRRQGTDFLFANVQNIFKDADFVIGNLECSISKKKQPSESTADFFCAEPEAVTCLKGAGVSVLSVTNNHIMENGLPVFQGTIDLLRENRITPIGVTNKNEIIGINGKQIGFLAYSFIDDGIPESGYNKISTKDKILRDLEKIKPESDLIIVSLHWGMEFVPFPSPEQVEIGRSLIDAGADIILGGHPHVSQGYEYYKDGLIIYSLGDFIFDHTYIPSTRESFIAKVVVNDSPRSVDVEFIPIQIDLKNYRPQIADPIQGRSMLDRLESTRRSIEGHSSRDYTEKNRNYGEVYLESLAQSRGYMMSQFAKNFHRYSLSTSLDILKQYTGKKTRRMG